ncbi:MAG: phosphatase PAP2 family protein [Armatimonadetes bacterium]|nr:phosphatase PAP2 family protein [Armatimonadota bacterium]
MSWFHRALLAATIAIVPASPVVADSFGNRQGVVQGAKALAATCTTVQVLKHTIHEQRPDSSGDDSFPSGHTALAFAGATMISDYHPKWEIPAYGAAALVGWSRVEEGEHRWREVIAGALLGHLIARQFTRSHFAITPGGVEFRTSW